MTHSSYCQACPGFVSLQAEVARLTAMAEALAADDALRLTRPELFGQSVNPEEAEPGLANAVTFDPINRTFRMSGYTKHDSVYSDHQLPDCYSANDLESIARHMRWRERQAAKPKPCSQEVTDEMVRAFWRADRSFQESFGMEHTRCAIAAALAVLPPLTPKEVRS